MDVIDELVLKARPVDEPVRWLMHDGRSLRQGFTGDHTWVRILDVPAALSTRGYAMPGQVVLEVTDTDHGGWAAGRYLLDADDDGAICTPTTRSADLVMPQRALAGAYLGDHSLRALAVAGGVDELTPRALARTDAMFATALSPWNATPF
jgi:predicted acetyltransferase